MPAKYVLDTLALIWYLEGNPRLGPNARAMSSDPSSNLFLPLIALAEACWMTEHGRSSIPTAADLLAAVDADLRVTLVPLDRAVLNETLLATAIPEMHDRQIVATARLLAEAGETVVLLTRDTQIAGSGLVPVLW